MPEMPQRTSQLLHASRDISACNEGHLYTALLVSVIIVEVKQLLGQFRCLKLFGNEVLCVALPAGIRGVVVNCAGKGHFGACSDSLEQASMVLPRPGMSTF